MKLLRVHELVILVGTPWSAYLRVACVYVCGIKAIIDLLVQSVYPMEGVILVDKVEYFPREKIYVYLDFPTFMFSSVERANRLALVSGEIKSK